MNLPAGTKAIGAEVRRLQKAVYDTPSSIELRRQYALQLARAGEPRAALTEYRILLGQVPHDPEIAANAGLIAMRCSEEESVVSLIDSAAEANPGHARLWQVRGLVHRSLDQHLAALVAFDHAAAIAPENGLIAHGRARTSLEAGLPASALFEQSLRLAPGDEAVAFGWVAAMVAENRWDAAESALHAWVRRRPEWAAGHGKLARLRWETGNQSGFSDELERAVAANAHLPELWRELIDLWMYAGRHAQALDVIGRARAALGPEPFLSANEAVCRDELGEADAAARLFESLYPTEDASLAVRHVRHLLRTGRVEAAAAMVEPWLTRPAAALFWPYAALAWRLLGDPRREWLEGDERMVGVYDLSAEVPIEALAERLRSLHLATTQPLEQSVRGGTQTDGALFSRVEPEIQRLRAALVEAVRAHVAQLPPFDAAHPQLGTRFQRDMSLPVRFSGSWSVRLTGGGCHANHVHPLGWFSSAFYVALPEEPARGAPPAGWLTLGEPEKELGLDLAPFRQVEPKPGRLVLFPSTMWHGTRPFASGERLTVAFDVAPPPR